MIVVATFTTLCWLLVFDAHDDDDFFSRYDNFFLRWVFDIFGRKMHLHVRPVQALRMAG